MPGLCRRFCHCRDLAPEPPPAQDERANVGESDCDGEDDDDVFPSSSDSNSQNAGTGECSESGNMDPSEMYRNHYTCDASFYGHPDSADCRSALQRLPDWAEAGGVVREYVHVDDIPNLLDSSYVEQAITLGNLILFSFHARVHAPLIITFRTCKIAVLLPEDSSQPPEPALVPSRPLNRVANTLEATCVSGLGIGGKFDHFRYQGSDLLVPDLFMFEKDSLMDDWLSLKTTNVVPSPKDRSQVCSGSCMDSDDCDINDNCVCASHKPIPLSSTWGQHACMYVAGAALAHAQATLVKPYTRCRGRCLPEDDNSINTTGVANTTDSAMDAFNASFVNLTRPSPSFPFSKYSPSNHSGANLRNSDSIAPIFDNSSALLIPVIPGSSNGSQDRSGTRDLICPCNCTYVSAACCLSRIVWEDPEYQVKMDPLPVNTTVCCNVSSGEWLRKKSSGSQCTL